MKRIKYNQGIAPIIAIIIGLIVVAGIVGIVATQKKAPVTEEPILAPLEEVLPDEEVTREEEKKEQAPQFASECGLIITSPLPNQTVSFPLTISGIVGGTGSIGDIGCTWKWRRFEGEAGNVKVFDINNNQVSDIVFIMPIEWMTSDPASFTIIIPSLTGTPTTSDLTIVFTETNDPAGFQGNHTLTIPISLSTQPQAKIQPPPPSITVISPNGGEVWQNGQTYAVSWNVQNVPQNAWIYLVVIGNIQGSPGDVDIAFMPLSGNSYSWTIPTDTYCVGDLCYAEPLLGTNLKVKAWLYDATGISNPCIGFCQPGTVPQLVTSDESDGVFIIQ